MSAGGQRSIGRVVLVMVILVGIGIGIAKVYYRNINSSVDPRIMPARELYASYDELARTGDYHAIFLLMDSIEKIYSSLDHYKGSFELGVLDNNRAAALITLALHRDSLPHAVDPFPERSSDSLIADAEQFIRRAIGRYEAWNAQFTGLSPELIREEINPNFFEGLQSYTEEERERFLKARIREIEAAIVENQRRMSVCRSNLGLIYRYQGNYELAVGQYEKSLELWDRNLDAENNLNRLLNRPLKKRNFIQKLFPPEKDSQ
jgi:tetratricopeptide (TPR) repeat protein